MSSTDHQHLLLNVVENPISLLQMINLGHPKRSEAFQKQSDYHPHSNVDHHCGQCCFSKISKFFITIFAEMMFFKERWEKVDFVYNQSTRPHLKYVVSHPRFSCMDDHSSITGTPASMETSTHAFAQVPVTSFVLEEISSCLVPQYFLQQIKNY